jgi:hypothetical protein
MPKLPPHLKNRCLKAQKALSMRQNGWLYTQIAPKLGYKSPNSVKNLINWLKEYEKLRGN